MIFGVTFHYFGGGGGKALKCLTPFPFGVNPHHFGASPGFWGGFGEFWGLLHFGVNLPDFGAPSLWVKSPTFWVPPPRDFWALLLNPGVNSHYFGLKSPHFGVFWGKFLEF